MSKINTVKKFIKYLYKECDNKRFMVYTNEDKDFEHYPDDQISFHGENEDEVFTFGVVKVKTEKR